MVENFSPIITFQYTSGYTSAKGPFLELVEVVCNLIWIFYNSLSTMNLAFCLGVNPIFKI